MPAREISADLHTALLVNSKMEQLDSSMKAYEQNQKKAKDWALEALLLINAHEVIFDCITNKEYFKLKTIYDKMLANPLFQRPTNEQIEEYRNKLQAHIIQAKIDREEAKRSRSYLKKIIKNSVAFAVGVIGFAALGGWGSLKIKSLSSHNDWVTSYNKTAAKLAIDSSVIVGMPVTCILMLKLIIGLVVFDEIEILQKTNGLLLLFEQLNNEHSQK